MPEITCSAQKCAYNNDCYCELESIIVDVDDCSDYNGCTCCNSFAEPGANNAITTSGPSYSSSVKCFAEDCIYNNNLECSADFISIEGYGAYCSTDTCCDSYKTSKR